MTTEILGFKAKVARTFWERTRGLIGTKSLAWTRGLLIERCNAIHTCFMAFPIDAHFLDANNQVMKVVRNIRPLAALDLGRLARKEGVGNGELAIKVKAGCGERVAEDCVEMMMAMPGPSVVDTLGFSQVMITSIWNMLAEPLKTFSAIAASEGYLPVT